MTIVVAAAIIDKDHVLIVRRGPGHSGVGEWEFPGGKVEPGESKDSALIREIQEELGVQIVIKKYVDENTYQYPNKLINLHLYWCELVNSKPAKFKLVDHDQLKWVQIKQLDPTMLSKADQKLAQSLKFFWKSK